MSPILRVRVWRRACLVLAIGAATTLARDAQCAGAGTPAAFDAALTWAGERHSSAVVVALGSRIVAERRWDRPASREGTTADGWPIEDVASVQKSVTSVLVAVAVEQGLLRENDSISRWLGAGWSKAPVAAEAAITVRHMLTMTSGLKEDLTFEAEAGSRWRYNTPAYCRLLEVLPAAASVDLPTLTRRWLTQPLGMVNSHWMRRTGPSSAVNPWGFLTSAHDLVLFGRMILAGGAPVLKDRARIAAMLRPSQSLNPDYGLLWWLNFAAKPGRPGRRIPPAPAELLAAEGARDCKLYLVPGRDVVVVRLGEPAGPGFVERFWELLWAAEAQL